jgi:hypothetical protein
LIGQSNAAFSSVIGIVETHAHDLGGCQHRRQEIDLSKRDRFSVGNGREEVVTGGNNVALFDDPDPVPCS